MPRFRALKPLQAPSLGLVQPDKGENSEFEWSGSIIGWHVAALDAEAEAMLEERAKILAERGDTKGPGGVGENPLPTLPFPKEIMNRMASAGMQAPGIVNAQLAALPNRERGLHPEKSEAPHPPPKRRRAAS